MESLIAQWDLPGEIGAENQQIYRTGAFSHLQGLKLGSAQGILHEVKAIS